MNQYCNLQALYDQLDIIDNQISLILDIAQKHVEGPKHGVPYSTSKLKGYLELLYYTSKMKMVQEKNINLQEMERRKTDAKIYDQMTDIAQVIEMKDNAIKKQKDIVNIGKELCETKVLDINSIIIEGDDEKSKRI